MVPILSSTVVAEGYLSPALSYSKYCCHHCLHHCYPPNWSLPKSWRRTLPPTPMTLCSPPPPQSYVSSSSAAWSLPPLTFYSLSITYSPRNYHIATRDTVYSSVMEPVDKKLGWTHKDKEITLGKDDERIISVSDYSCHKLLTPKPERYRRLQIKCLCHLRQR